MTTLRSCFLLFVGMTVAGVANAGEFNKVKTVGDAAPVFTNLDGTDGKKHSLDDYKSKAAVVIVFTCNSCPIANSYEERIAALAKKYASGPEAKVALIAINVNTVPEDRLDKMIERAKKKKYAYPYLYDPSQKIAREYGAMYTPEFFILNADRKIAYMGAFDDKIKADEAKQSFAVGGRDAVLAGETPPERRNAGPRLQDPLYESRVVRRLNSIGNQHLDGIVLRRVPSRIDRVGCSRSSGSGCRGIPAGIRNPSARDGPPSRRSSGFAASPDGP
ncbi:MAG: thioredoxin family protein [Gemmataceae bacterium]